jgi:hypothetical protein
MLWDSLGDTGHGKLFVYFKLICTPTSQSDRFRQQWPPRYSSQRPVGCTVISMCWFPGVCKVVGVRNENGRCGSASLLDGVCYTGENGLAEVL